MDAKLIESALQLTGKTLIDIEDEGYPSIYGYKIENFCYYLLSPEFIEKYQKKSPYAFSKYKFMVGFGQAIYEYQRRDEEYPEGNETPLIELLSKIGNV